MVVSYKNFWSLNTDEAVVAGILRSETKKNVEVLMPLNAQMKDVDLVVMDLQTKKSLAIQVKGSKAYEPKKSETQEFGEGSTGWFFLKVDTIEKATADYFIFLVYVLRTNKKTGRRDIEPHTLTIPTLKVREFCKKYKRPHPDRYSFYFWINSAKKISFDFRDKRYDVSEYLDQEGFKKMNDTLVGRV